ncbi:hypothetical protein VE03_10276 [Pseudogymnoascus sp. 23342-1-I1]|nr:hypothetical protein VE03_10276 [Pseudogymnoascus sp. 23342-1-I1]
MALLPTPEAKLSLPAGSWSGVGGRGVSTAGSALKKKCDPCKACPQRYLMPPSPWQVLGCFHGPLTKMVRKCLDGLPSHPTAGSPSPTSDISWAPEINYLVKNHHGFVSLSDEFWDSRELYPINSTDLMDTTPDLTDVAYRSQEYSSAVGLLKTVVLNRAYLGRTAYNPFALLRVGREAMNACNDPSNWRLYTHAQSLLLTALRYRLALASTLPTTPPPLTDPLTAFLLEFDTRFPSRKDVSPSGWLAAFYSLCLFSITKTLLLDTPTPHQSTLATVHKILVSVFTWSAKLSAWCPTEFTKLGDPLIQDWSHGSNSAVQSHIRHALQATQTLVHRDGSEKSRIRHTKDFLLGLGAGDVERGVNGFLGYVVGEGFAASPPAERGDKEILKLPHYPSAAWRVTSPTSSSASREKSEREGGVAPSYYRRPLGPESSVFGAGNGSMPLPSIATVVGSANDGGSSSSESPSNAAHKLPRKRQLSSEQRDHAAVIRRLGACGVCKARKVTCNVTHSRGDLGPTSPRTQRGEVALAGVGGEPGTTDAHGSGHMGVGMLACRSSPDSIDGDDGVGGGVLVEE